MRSENVPLGLLMMMEGQVVRHPLLGYLFIMIQRVLIGVGK